MDTHSHSIRVLVRPPPAPQPPPPPDPPRNGVVVVGFIGKHHHDLAHLINKIMDSHVFGSGNLDTPLRSQREKTNPEMSNWFRSRSLSYYHDEDQRILYLQFSLASRLVTEEESSEEPVGFESILEDQEFGDLQGLMFMFSVCHVIILILEGSRFDTQWLKKFRVLQAAKHTMVPFIRSQNMSPATSRPRSSAQSRVYASGASPNNASPAKTQGILNRNASVNTLMSSLGSYTSLLPGQCTPVALFVFYDDFSEIQPSGNMEEPSETSALNVSSNLNSSSRPGMGPTKGSNSVVVLARPVNKSEASLRRKLQSSLEAQIRFSIKKCRTLSIFESSHTGSRSRVIASSAPLFSLDASRAVSLVDASSIQSGESLEFAIGLVQEVLDGKATPDSLLLESHQQNANKEDILSVKEFIYRQSDLLRGKGSLVSNSNSGSAGVGMVAAAAAAAAASTSTSTPTSASASTSASSGKTTAPELPTFDIWSTSSQLILQKILSAKRACTYESKTNKMHEQNAVSTPADTVAASSDPYESAVYHLENGIGMNTRFSTLWCEKAYPVAKEVYLDNLPPCYPSFLHEDHLKKALCVLTSMVKGPAVQLYMKKLKDECTSIWNSGRQLCDAVSLTGKPCMLQKHDIQTLSTDEIKPHSSGFVYLHACACGRSRRLRTDPFDFETANVVHNTFADCDKLLPSVKLPEGIVKGPIQPSSWSLIRVGSARYYDPSKGLFQSGFFATQRFLLWWTIEKLKEESHSLLHDSPEVYSLRVETSVDADRQTSDAIHLGAGEPKKGVVIQKRHSSEFYGNNSKGVSSAGGLSNFTMRKPFSEVVAGPAAANSAFPPLLSRKQPLQVVEKGVKVHNVTHRGLDKLGEIVYSEESKKVEHISSVGNSLSNGIAGSANNGNSFPHLRSNTPPLNMNSAEQIKAANSMKCATVYVGFEHECPHGHRFMLTLDHLSDLGSSYSVPEDNVNPVSLENLDKKQETSKLGKIGGHGRTRWQLNGIIARGGSGKGKNVEKSKQKMANGNISSNKFMQSTRQGKDQSERTDTTDFEDLDSELKPTAIDDRGGAFSLLNRSLPIYMNCPHCRESTTKTDASSVKYASTISQLLRIFVVTPSFPISLAANPIVQFELSCLPSSVPDREQKLRFSLGCPVILPPDSFLSLRLPFVYGVELEDGSLHSLKPFENQPQLTAYIVKGTTLRVASDKSNLNPASVT